MAGNNKHADFILRRTLHIDPEERYSRQPSNLDHRAKQAGVDPFLEEEPTVKEFLGELVPSREGVANYLRSLFPSSTWIGRYNLHWLLGDSIAGKQERVTNRRLKPSNSCLRSSGVVLTSKEKNRSHCWPRCSPPSNGVCIACPAFSRVRPVHIFHRRRAVLDFWDI